MKKIFMATMLSAASILGTSALQAKEEPKSLSSEKLQGSYAYDVASCIEDTRQQVGNYAKNNETVLSTYDNFMQVVTIAHKTQILTDENVQDILSATQFAAERHQFQTRKDVDKTPYIYHPMTVAYNLVYVGHVTDPNVIIATLLHDTVEDTDTTFEEINARFGSTVEGFVREVTDDQAIAKQEQKRQQILKAPFKSKEAAQIKLADRLANLTDLTNAAPPSWTKEAVAFYFDHSQQLINALPDANPQLKDSVQQLINQFNAQ